MVTMNNAQITKLLSAMNWVCQSIIISLAILTATSIAGWFASGDALNRATSAQLFSWLGYSTLIATPPGFFVLFVHLEAKFSPYARLTIGLIITGWLSFGLMNTGLGVWSTIATLSRHSFKSDLTPNDYQSLVNDVAQAAGSPQTMIMPWKQGKVESPREVFISYEFTNRAICDGIRMENGLNIDGKGVAGRAFPTDKNTVLIYDDEKNSETEIKLFGVQFDNTSLESKRIFSSHLADAISKISSKNLTLSCFQPEFSEDAWICNSAEKDYVIFDLAATMLQRGQAVADITSLKGTSMERPYMNAQFVGQSQGCGIWKR
jgi:hypothetical protein